MFLSNCIMTCVMDDIFINKFLVKVIKNFIKYQNFKMAELQNGRIAERQNTKNLCFAIFLLNWSNFSTLRLSDDLEPVES